MEEQWKIIPGYSNYQASTLGRIRSIDRLRPAINPYSNKKFLLKGKLKSLTINKSGYKRLNISNDSKVQQSRTVHQLIALTFLPNPNNLPSINHKNGIKTDNRVDNLEWCSNSYNIKHAYDIGVKRISQKHRDSARKAGLKSGKPINQFDLTGKFIRSFPSAAQAARETGIAQPQISRVCLGIRKKTNGFIFKYKTHLL